MAAAKGNKYAVGADSGVKKAIETPEKMWELFQAYVKKTKADPFLVHDFVGKDGKSVYREKERPLSYEGFCCYLWDENIILRPDHYFINWEGRYEEFVGICAHIKQVIRNNQIQGGLVGIFNPSITQRLNGLVEKVESDNKHTVKGVNLIFNPAEGCKPLGEKEADGSKDS